MKWTVCHEPLRRARPAAPGRIHAVASRIPLIVLFAFVLAPPCWADEPTAIYEGDTVVVVKDGVKLGLRDKVSTVLSPGDRIHVTEVRGPWVGGYAIVDGKRYTGWVHKTEVKLAETMLKEVPVIKAPNKPDDPEAVAALERAGVRLEKGEHGYVHTADATESQVSDNDLVHFGRLYHLAVLDLSGRPVTDDGLKPLAGLSSLQNLYLARTGITDRAFDTIKTLPNLEVLVVQGTKVTGSGLKQLVGLKNLIVLNLGDCAVGDDALEPLEQLPQLDVLVLSGTKVTSSGVAHLAPIARLRVLNLIGCDVDDAGLEHLKGLAELRMLYLRNTKVTQEAVDQLKEAAPSLAIFRN